MANGLSVQQNVVEEYRPVPGCVITQLHKTGEKTVKEMIQRQDLAIVILVVQVRKIHIFTLIAIRLAIQFHIISILLA